jgi:hypothetical protein
VQVQAILPVLFLEGSRHSRARWVEHAAQVSVRRLYDDVDRTLSGIDLELDSHRQTCAQTKDAEATHSEPETAQFFFAAPPDVSSSAMAGAARCRAARRTGTCTATTSSSARTMAPTIPGIGRRCAQRIITAACTKGLGAFASGAGRPTGSASSFRS